VKKMCVCCCTMLLIGRAIRLLVGGGGEPPTWSKCAIAAASPVRRQVLLRTQPLRPPGHQLMCQAAHEDLGPITMTLWISRIVIKEVSPQFYAPAQAAPEYFLVFQLHRPRPRRQ